MKRLKGFSLVATLSLSLFTKSARPESIAIAPIKQLDVAKAVALSNPDNHERYLNLHKLFDFAGCNQGSMQELKVSHAAEPDIVCTLPGVLTPATGPDPQRLIVIARYDHTGQGSGAIDNWTGAAMLPLVFASLMPGYREHTMQFVATFGPNGLRTFLKTLSHQQKEATIAIVDLRDVGLEPTRLSILFEDAGGNDSSMLGKGNSSGMVTRAMRDSSNAAQSAAKTSQTRSDGTGPDERDRRVYAWRAASTLTKLILPELAAAYMEGFQGAKPAAAKDESDLILQSGIPGVVIHSVTKANAALPGSKEDSLDHILQPAYYETYYYTAIYLLLLDHPIAVQAPAKK